MPTSHRTVQAEGAEGDRLFGQIQGRLSVRELDVVEAMVGEGVFPEVTNSEQTVEVWVPSMMLPTWASEVGEKPKAKGKGKGTSKEEENELEDTTEVGHELDGDHSLESFDPPGDVLADLEQLDAPFGIGDATNLPGAKRGWHLGVVDLTRDEGVGFKRSVDADREEGPSKKRKQVSEGGEREVIDLTDEI
jgi:hypothetical protein